MIKKHKISILVNSMSRGGAEKQCYYLSQMLPIKKIYTLINKNSFKNIENLVQPLIKKEKPRFLVQVFKGVFNLKKYIKKDDIILSFMERSNFVNILTKLMFKKHLSFISVRIAPSYYNSIKFGFIIRFLMKKLYPFADLIIVNSNESADQLKCMIKNCKNKIIYIPNIIELEKDNSILLSNKAFLITVGRLEKQKNIEFQINLIYHLKKENINETLFIIGEGTLKNKLIYLCESLKLKVGYSIESKAKDIVFLGYQNAPYKFLNEKSIFMLSSFHEGMPNVMIEAMSKGAIAIGANCQTGPKELLSPNENFSASKIYYEYGCLLPVPHGTEIDFDNWSKVVISLLKDSKMRSNYSEKSKIRASSFLPENVIPHWENALQLN